MDTFPTERLRNVVLLSHSGAGKTSLSEALLFATGAISRQGRVEDGTTTSDYEPEEVKRRGSIQLTVLASAWKDTKINLIDTPGYADFLGEVVSGLRVADAAILVVSATSGVEGGTELMWRHIQEQALPTIIFVSKMDRENADFYRTLGSIQASLGKRCVPIQLPIGAAASFRGVVSLLSSSEGVSGELDDKAKELRERLTEAIAETDDTLTAEYLDGKPLSDSEVTQGLKAGIASGAIVPVLLGAPTQSIGIKELLDTIVSYLPSPLERPHPQAAIPSSSNKETLSPDSSRPLAALVFKTTADAYVGKLSYLRVYSGIIKSDSHVFNTSKGQMERIGQLFCPRGHTQEHVLSLAAGDIGAIAKLSVTGTGDTLGMKEHPFVMEGLKFPHYSYSMAVYPKAKGDLDKMSPSLSRLIEEDPSLHIFREPDTAETILSGLGDTHLDVSIEKVRRKFGTSLVLQVPKVPYKETISSQAQIEHRHKQQSGGHGHFAHIFLRLEPLPRGSGIEFASAIVGGVVPKEFVPAVEKGAKRACQDGALAGFPIVDIKVVLYDGSYHPVDSAGQDFEIAANSGLKKGFLLGNPILTEPIVKLSVTVPDSYTGDVIGDLNGRRGHILGMNPLGNSTTLIEAEVPHAELQRYALDLRSRTQGRGTFSTEFSRYEEVPAHLAQRIVEQAKKEKEEAKS